MGENKDSSFTRFHTGSSVTNLGDPFTKKITTSNSTDNNPLSDILKAVSNNPELMTKLQDLPEAQKDDFTSSIQDFLNSYKTMNNSGNSSLSGNTANIASNIASLASGISSSGKGYLLTSAGIGSLAVILPQLLNIGMKLYGRYEISKMYDPKTPEGRARLSNIMSSFHVTGHNAQFSENTMQSITQNISNLLQAGRDIEYASALKLFNK